MGTYIEHVATFVVLVIQLWHLQLSAWSHKTMHLYP